MKKRLFLLSVLCCLSSIWSANVKADEVELDTIVVTPYNYEQEIQKTSASVTVITKEEIKNSNAKTIPDVLRPVPGLVVRDWFGNATKASVDIRGFGEQGGMNILLLIDGRRANEVDLSAVDWTQIPLNQVERIEVIRGGNSVLYGDNAVSGVINIVTKKGRGKPKLSLGIETGSYEMNAQRLSIDGSEDRLSYWFSASKEATHGYRNNSFYKSKDFATKLEYDCTDELALNFRSGYKRASYGLPGALFDTHLDSFNRRYSRFGDDRATDKEYYFVTGAKKEFNGTGDFLIDVSYKDKYVLSNFIGANAGWNPILKSYIKTLGITPKFKITRPIFNFNNILLTGLDFFRYDYSANTYNTSGVLQDFTDINKTAIAGYLQDQFTIFENLIFTGGYRYETVRYQFDYHDNSGFSPDVDSDIKPNKKAYTSALVYTYKDDSNLFLNTNQSFRFPATDEYFTWGSLNTGLKPQNSRTYEGGIRHRFNPKLKCELSLYIMNIKNELYYNPTGGPFGFGANENYDKTRHEGFEAAFDSKITDWLEATGNYSQTVSKFKDGVYVGNYVPMVPRHKANLNFRFLLPNNFTVNTSLNYLGKRYFINDQANAFSRLNGYFLANMNVSYKFKNFTVTAAINNIFDKKYSEYGVYSSSQSAKAYYPNPERNYSLKIDFLF
ncbi:MAG: TonB-dependent receptor [Candidatus Omnitrophota bacterium]